MPIAAPENQCGLEATKTVQGTLEMACRLTAGLVFRKLLVIRKLRVLP
jgi:hypothetical protein